MRRLDGEAVRPLRPEPRCTAQRAGRTVPVTSPRAIGGAVRAGRGGGDGHRVAVGQEGPAAPSPTFDRLGAAPGQLQERADLAAVRAGDGAGGVQVAGAQRRAVDGEVGQLLGRRPVHGGERRLADPLAVPLDAPAAGPAPGAGRRAGSRRTGGSCSGAGTNASASASSGVTQAETEVAKDLPRNGPERLVLPGLDVPGRPVVDQHHPEDVVGEVVDGDPVAQRARHADHEADLGLDVEAYRRAGDRALGGGPLAGRPDRPACRRRPPCRPGRGSRSAGASSWAAAAAGRGGRSARRCRRGARRSRSRRSRPPRTAAAAPPRPAAPAAAPPPAGAPGRSAAR